MNNKGDTYKFSIIVRNGDFIVRDHQLHNVHTVPGVTFLDIIYRFLKSKGFNIQEVEFRRILFLEPVATAESFDKKIQIILEKSGNYWTIKTSSQKFKDNQPLSSEWISNFQGEIHINKETLSKKIDIDGLKQNSKGVYDMDNAYLFSRKAGLYHYEFMKLLGQVYEGEDYVLAEVHLSDLAKQYMDSFYLHPAYLDGSLSVPGILLLHKLSMKDEMDSKDLKPYIPTYIDSFRAIDGFKDKLFVYGHRDNIRGAETKDIMHLDVEIYNEEGKLVALYKNFAAKQVRIKERIRDLAKNRIETEIEKQKDQTLPVERETIQKTTKEDLSSEPAEGEDRKQKAIENDLRQMLADIKNKQIDDIKADIDFYDQGLDSTDLLQVVQKLEDKIGEKLYPTLLFEYRNISKLVDFLTEKYGDTYPVDKAAATSIEFKKTATEDIGKPTPLSTVGKEADIDFCYSLRWKQSPLSQAQPEMPETAKEKVTDKKKVLIIYSPHSYELEKALAEAQLGNEVIEIKLGNENRKHSEQSWEVKADDSSAIDRCIQQLQSFHSIFFLGGIQTQELALDDLEALDQSQDMGVLSLYRLIKSLIRTKRYKELQQLKVITGNVHQVFPSERIKPFSASLHGLTTAISNEYPKVDVNLVDIDLDGTNADLSKEELRSLVKQIMAEESNKNLEMVAIRKGKRYIRTVEPVLLPPVSQIPFKKHGVYLILGGAGGIGLELSRYLAEKVEARLVLIGRSELKPGQQAIISEIESKGGKVLYVQADVTNPASIKIAVDKAKLLFGKINGVIHSAVVLRDKTLEMMDETNFRSVLDPKVRGSVVLYKLMKDEPLDFMMFFSSIQSYIGNVGQSNYAAASTFKDAFALSINQRTPYPVKIINWGYWGSVGVGASENMNRKMASSGILSINPEEGMEIVQRVLGNRIDQIIPFKMKDYLLQKMGIERKEPEDIGKFNENISSDTVARSGDVSILSISEQLYKENFMGLWKNLKEGKNSSMGNLNIIDEYLRLAVKHGDRMLHLLVNTASAKNMEVVISGHGKTILLINGFGLTAPQWLYQFKDWSSKYQLVAIHIPGNGLSEGGKDLTLPGLSKMFIEVLEKLGVLWPIHVIGSSWGGLIAQSMAKEYPEKVASLILAGSFCQFDEDSEIILREMVRRDFENQNDEKHYKMILDCEYLNNNVLIKYPRSSTNLFSTLDILPKIAVPTLIIAGKQDVVLDAQQFQTLHAKIPNSEYYEMATAGHIPNITHSQEFNKKVIEFIEKNEGMVKKLKESPFTSPEEFLKRYGDFWKGDLALADEFIATNFVRYGSTGTLEGLDNFKQFVKKLLFGFPDMHFTYEEIIEQGDKLAIRYTFNGTHKGTYLGVPATGKNLKVDGIAIYHFVDGKIQEIWDSLDLLGLLQQLGVVPALRQAG